MRNCWINYALCTVLTSLGLSASAAEDAPSRQERLHFQDIAVGEQRLLQGLHPSQTLEFSLRADQIVEQAYLHLVFTPSPALRLDLSYLRIYLNDELMTTVALDQGTEQTPAAPGERQTHEIALDPLMMTRFNQLRLEFVGHYQAQCQDLSHRNLWLELSPQTYVQLDQTQLPLVNDLAYFPEPFLDGGDMSPQNVPIVFPAQPGHESLKAAAIMASYFGLQAKWRTLNMPAYLDELPDGHAVVLASNDQWPDFLADLPQVEGPTIELYRPPGQDYQQLLLILGRNEADLVTAATALTMGTPVLRGQSVQVETPVKVAPRQPYDAPFWLSTEGPVPFHALQTYAEQFEVKGQYPRPIELEFRLPPDLFVWRNQGVPLSLFYRYSALSHKDESRLTVSINDRFLDGYRLRTADEGGQAVQKLRLALQGAEGPVAQEQAEIPAIKIGPRNRLRFDFSFQSALTGQPEDECRTLQPVDMRAAIDGHSTIDFSGFPHFLAMPNLGVFAQSGFPFSRMADLSETVALVPESISSDLLSTFLTTWAVMGAQIGYPALGLRVLSNAEQANQLDADILVFGELPESMRQRPDAYVLLEELRTTWQVPDDSSAATRVELRSTAPMAALASFAAEQPERTVVALLANSARDHQLLREALMSSGKRDVMTGSVVIIRDSGVYAEQAGPTYYIGALPWWHRLWFYYTERPFTVVFVALVAVLLMSLLLWRGLRRLARRRVSHERGD